MPIFASDDSPAHTIVLAIDGLRAAALGAYGATTYATPTLDQFAADGELTEWCYADTPQLADLYAKFVQENGTLFATDDKQVVKLPFAQQFKRSTLLPAPQVEKPAESIGETTQAAAWGGFAEALIEHAQSLDAGEHVFAWFHARGLYGPWDAPPASYYSLLGEDDPVPENTTERPDVFFDDNGSAEACDARFAAACRYAGQVMTLDACLAGWLDVIEPLFEGEALRIVLMGVRGFPLGEHGQIGGVDTRLFSEQQQVPLLVRTGDPARRFVRDPQVTTLSTALSNDSNESVVLTSETSQAVVTADWLLRRCDETELYVKPDDRWEQNDIASLKEDVVTELETHLKD